MFALRVRVCVSGGRADCLFYLEAFNPIALPPFFSSPLSRSSSIYIAGWPICASTLILLLRPRERSDLTYCTVTTEDLPVKRFRTGRER